MKKYLFTFSFLMFLTSAQSLFPQKNLILESRLSYPGRTLSGVWHYADSTGKEYALVGTSTAISIVDISIPSIPIIRFEVPTTAPAPFYSQWQELKTWGKYAYCGTEGGGGITIIDLSKLPDTVYYKVWQGDTSVMPGLINNSHTVATADGYLYVFGTWAVPKGGAVIASLADPWNPQYLGMYDKNYVHDGYIRNDTLYTSELQGGFAVVDIVDKANPKLLATQETPGKFNHNTWLSDNGKYLYAADEQWNAPLGSFDISDLSNIRLIDTYRTVNTPDREVHNVRVLNDYLVNACYGSQVTIVDAHKPDNLVEIGYHKTGASGLCWDVSPYLPSGLIIATDKDSGLFVFSPAYKRACYLEGTVTDSISGSPLNTVKVEILSTPITDSTVINGTYKTGYSDAGAYSVRFSKNGFVSKTIPNVTLSQGNVTLLNVKLDSLRVGIPESGKAAGISFFPNPSRNSFTLTTEGIPLQNCSLSVFSVSGAELIRLPVKEKNTYVDCREIPAGIYIIRVIAGTDIIKEEKLVIAE